MTPAVSVIIPAFNALHTIVATLRTVMDQTFQDFEVIVVDDGSTDGTAEAVNGVSESIRCVQIPNGGVASARNRGTAESSGRYLAFLDADDLWLPTKLERQVELLDVRADAGGCYTGVIRVGPNLSELARTPARHFSDLCESLLLFSSVIPSSPSSLMVRRSVDERVGGFDPRFSQCADWDYLLRLSRITILSPVTEFLVKHREGGWNMSRNIPLLETDTFAVLDRFFGEETDSKYKALRPHSYSNHWMIVSGSYLHAGQVRSSLRCLGQGLRTWPRNVTRPLGLPGRLVRRHLSAKSL